jgi:hypothetical protein
MSVTPLVSIVSLVKTMTGLALSRFGRAMREPVTTTSVMVVSCAATIGA